MSVVGALACAATTLAYVGFKQFCYRYVPGDENIYYYMAKVMAEGKAWPYRDFFFAHPPVQLFVAAGAFKVFGADYEVARSLPVLATLASGLAVFAIGARRFGTLEGAVAQAAFLFAHDVLRNSSHFTGANLGLALFLWGAYCLLRRRDLVGGLLLGLSAQTVVYAVPAVVMVLAWRFVESPRRALRAVGAALGVYLLISVGCLLFAGGEYTEAVFKFHLMKKDRGQDQEKFFSKLFRFHNFYLAWSPVVAAAALVWWRRVRPKPVSGEGPESPSGSDCRPSPAGRKDRRRRGPKAAKGEQDSLAWALRRLVEFLGSRQGLAVGLILYLGGYMVFLLRLREWYDFYFMFLFPVRALLTGFAVGEIAAGIAAVFRRRSVWPPVRSVFLCAMVVVGYAGVKLSLPEQFPKEKDREFAWLEAPNLGPINSLYRGAFWQDVRRVDGHYAGPTYYLWHEARHLQELQGAVEYLVEHSAPTDRLFGESGLAPLVAFLADRDLAGFVADTNTKRFSSGQTTVAELLAKIDVPELRYVFASRRGRRFQYVNRLLEDWLRADFVEVYRFQSQMRPGVTWLLLERRSKQATGTAKFSSGAPCRFGGKELNHPPSRTLGPMAKSGNVLYRRWGRFRGSFHAPQPMIARAARARSRGVVLPWLGRRTPGPWGLPAPRVLLCCRARYWLP